MTVLPANDLELNGAVLAEECLAVRPVLLAISAILVSGPGSSTGGSAGCVTFHARCGVIRPGKASFGGSGLQMTSNRSTSSSSCSIDAASGCSSRDGYR